MTDRDDKTSEKKTRLETHLQIQLGSRVRQFRVLCRNDGFSFKGVCASTMLIADGEADLCDFYRRFTTERGYEVDTCRDVLDRVRKLRQVTPAVLVLDLELPWCGGDGVQQCYR